MIHQENGKDFTIEAKNLSSKNKYIQSAKLNGEDFPKAWIEHEDIIMGGTLVLEMGPVPQKWGTEILPPSKSDQ